MREPWYTCFVSLMDFLAGLAADAAWDVGETEMSKRATHRRTREHSSRLILTTIYDYGEISRADVARVTRLTRTTVSNVVRELMKKGLVIEVGHGVSAGGKPPVLLSVRRDARHLIGIDVAGGEFRGAVVNLQGEIRHRVSVPLRGRNGKAALEVLYEMIDDLVASTDSRLLGIGIGASGLMDVFSGVVRRSVNLDWEDLPLRSLLRSRYDLPVYVANDCQVAALAEFIFGGGREDQNLVVVKIAHGIGAGIVLNGQLFYGDTCGAGEIGHVVVVEKGQPCRCGNLGCLETVASDRAIVQQAQALFQSDPDSSLRRFCAASDEVTMDEICRAIAVGDKKLRQMIMEVGRNLGIALANLVSVLSVRHIIISGDVACLGRDWLRVVKEEMLRHSLAMLSGETEVDFSRIRHDDIVILGASALVMASELGLFSSC